MVLLFCGMAFSPEGFHDFTSSFNRDFVNFRLLFLDSWMFVFCLFFYSGGGGDGLVVLALCLVLTAKSGGEQVSIFRLTLKTCPPIAREAAKAGMQSLRTLRHPHVLACLDSVQLDTEYVIATGERLANLVPVVFVVVFLALFRAKCFRCLVLPPM